MAEHKKRKELHEIEDFFQIDLIQKEMYFEVFISFIGFVFLAHFSFKRYSNTDARFVRILIYPHFIQINKKERESGTDREKGRHR